MRSYYSENATFVHVYGYSHIPTRVICHLSCELYILILLMTLMLPPKNVLLFVALPTKDLFSWPAKLEHIPNNLKTRKMESSTSPLAFRSSRQNCPTGLYLCVLKLMLCLFMWLTFYSGHLPQYTVWISQGKFDFVGKEKSEKNLKTIIWRYFLNSLDEIFFNVEL